MVAPLVIAGVLTAVVGCSVIYCCWRSSSSLSRKENDGDGATLTNSIRSFLSRDGDRGGHEAYLTHRKHDQNRGDGLIGEL